MANTIESFDDHAREAEIRNAIEAFEQILSVVPDDIPSLRAILNAYEDLQDRQQASAYIQRLAKALLDEGDQSGIADLVPKVEEYCVNGFDELVELVGQMKRGLDAGEDGVLQPEDSREAVDVLPAGDSPSRTSVSHRFDIEPQLAFAWALLEAGDLTQDEYSGVVQDLTELSVGESADTVSVLHVLEARGFRRLEHVIGRIAEECSAPTVSLACFHIQTDEYLLPMDFMLRRGALVFDHVAEHLIVVVLNPYDERLRKDVQSIVGRKCHFFTTLPSEFDEALNRISDVQSEAGIAPTPE